MKIVIIRHSIRNRGGDKLILDYCDFLVEEGHEVVYWTNEVDTHFFIDPRIQIKKIPCAGVIGTLLFSLLSRSEADIVLVDLVVMAFFVSFLNGRKTVYLAQDDDRAYYSSPVLRSFIGLVYRMTLGLLKVRTICVSDALAQKLRLYAKGPLSVVPNGIDHEKFFFNKGSSFLVQRTKPVAVVLYARSDYRKGLDVGIKAVKELARLRGEDDWELWVVGDGFFGIDAAGLKIKYWGFLKDAELRDVFSAADIYLSCSRNEGFGLMQLQAIACGLVMVTTQAFSLVKDEINGIVAPFEDWQYLAKGIDRVIRDRALFVRLRENGFFLAKKYDLKKSCIQFEQALASYI